VPFASSDSPRLGWPPGLFLNRNNVIRMGVPPIRIEILTSVSGIEFEWCYSEKELTRIEEILVPVINLARLRQNKAASGRAKDLADLENLPEEVFHSHSANRARARPISSASIPSINASA
jgi:hypothetical protein